MKITYKNYIIELEHDHYNLYKNIIINKKDGTEEPGISNIGYGYKLAGCLERIIKEELNKKEDTVSLSIFLANYIQQKEELVTSIKKYLTVNI